MKNTIRMLFVSPRVLLWLAKAVFRYSRYWLINWFRHRSISKSTSSKSAIRLG